MGQIKMYEKIIWMTGMTMKDEKYDDQKIHIGDFCRSLQVRQHNCEFNGCYCWSQYQDLELQTAVGSLDSGISNSWKNE